MRCCWVRCCWVRCCLSSSCESIEARGGGFASGVAWSDAPPAAAHAGEAEAKGEAEGLKGEVCAV